MRTIVLSFFPSSRSTSTIANIAKMVLRLRKEIHRHSLRKNRLHGSQNTRFYCSTCSLHGHISVRCTSFMHFSFHLYHPEHTVTFFCYVATPKTIHLWSSLVKFSSLIFAFRYILCAIFAAFSLFSCRRHKKEENSAFSVWYVDLCLTGVIQYDM